MEVRTSAINIIEVLEGHRSKLEATNKKDLNWPCRKKPKYLGEVYVRSLFGILEPFTSYDQDKYSLEWEHSVKWGEDEPVLMVNPSLIIHVGDIRLQTYFRTLKEIQELISFIKTTDAEFITLTT